MSDPTEPLRRILVQEINSGASDRAELEHEHGQVWDTEQLQRDFTVTGFMAPFVSVTRKSDGAKGLLLFCHSPRFYFSFQKS